MHDHLSEFYMVCSWHSVHFGGSIDCIKRTRHGIRSTMAARNGSSYYGFIPSPNAVYYRGKSIVLKVIEITPPEVQLISSESLHKYTQQHLDLVMGMLFSMNAESAPTTICPLQPHMSQVLYKFSDVFEEPTKLPLVRSHNHHIPLKEGDDPINVRPYHYPYV